MTIKKLITLEQILELQRQNFLNNFVTNVREVEHLGLKLILCDNMNGNIKVFDENKYICIGMYDKKPLYQKKIYNTIQR